MLRIRKNLIYLFISISCSPDDFDVAPYLWSLLDPDLFWSLSGLVNFADFMFDNFTYVTWACFRCSNLFVIAFLDDDPHNEFQQLLLNNSIITSVLLG